jgi:hypothetical protein
MEGQGILLEVRSEDDFLSLFSFCRCLVLLPLPRRILLHRPR